MANTPQVRFFLGANAPTGFYSLYDQLIDLENAQVLYLLKGGPGCGKSTLMRQVAAQAAQASAFVTPEGRLDTELLQTFAQPQEEPSRRRYRFWVEFTPEDVAWFKAAAAERGFRFGSVK